MKLYMLRELEYKSNVDESWAGTIYGIYSSKEKAKKEKETLEKRWLYHNEWWHDDLDIIEFDLDEPTKLLKMY